MTLYTVTVLSSMHDLVAFGSGMSKERHFETQNDVYTMWPAPSDREALVLESKRGMMCSRRVKWALVVNENGTSGIGAANQYSCPDSFENTAFPSNTSYIVSSPRPLRWTSSSAGLPFSLTSNSSQWLNHRSYSMSATR